jgi:dienelactone hydrolase
MKKTGLLLLFCFVVLCSSAQTKRQQLISLLGKMPKYPTLKVDTLERTPLEKGMRYKIRYLVEKSDTSFGTPEDYSYAYLFVPKHKKNEKLPAIVAIHQDGSHDGLGKLEPAGLGGDADQHYGIELFERGYIVICPDRYYHGQRRRIINADSVKDSESDRWASQWAAQLLLQGRNTSGKEVYDLVRTVDVLIKTLGIDTARIGAIGHSAGGYALGYFMFYDKRIKAGASSCGVFELANWYDQDVPRINAPDNVIPGLLPFSTADFIGAISPRPFLMTRGMNEWGWGNEKEKANSLYHVNNTKKLEARARAYYGKKGAASRLKTIYFQENGGMHSFPTPIRQQVYQWLDSYLRPNRSPAQTQ